MSDLQRSKPQIVRARGARREKIVDQLTRLRESALGTEAERRLRDALSTAAEMLSKRENVEAVQTVLARIGQFAAEASFKADPDAQRLFDYATWAEGVHGRPVVLAATLQLAQRLIDKLASGAPTHPETYAAMQEEVRRWARILALGYPAASDTFDLNDVPEEFRPVFDARRTHVEPGSTTTSAIQRIMPGSDEATMTYMMVTLPRFLQTYLMRGIVDALPDLVAQIDVPGR